MLAGTRVTVGSLQMMRAEWERGNVSIGCQEYSARDFNKERSRLEVTYAGSENGYKPRFRVHEVKAGVA